MFLNDRLLSSETLSLYTDAATSLGYGAIYSSNWFYEQFPAQCRELNITLLVVPNNCGCEYLGSFVVNSLHSILYR